MFRFNSCVPGLILCLATAAAGQYDLPVRQHTLRNGLKLLVLERPGSARVACKIFTDMGALNEFPGQLGAAHFLEHLMFKGTHSLGTRNWQAESPQREQIYRTEALLIEARNQARNATRQRGVFHDYRHAASTSRIDSLSAALARLDSAAAVGRENGAMMKWYQAYGGNRIAATTEQEYMKFDVNLPANRVALFLRIEADRMRNSVFREFEQERMILLEQRFGDLNRPGTAFAEALNALVQTVHPVFWPEGYLSDFNNYTRHTERELYETFFVPNNTTLVFVGGVSQSALIPLVERYFGWMPRGPEPPAVEAVEPVPQAEKRLTWRDREFGPRVEIRFLIPGIGHPDRPHLDVLAETLLATLRDINSRSNTVKSIDINTRVVHTDRFGVPATLNISAELERNEDAGAGERLLLNGIETFKRDGAGRNSLAAAKKRLRTRWYRTARDPDLLAFEIGHFDMMDRWQTLLAHLRTRDETTNADLRRLARRYLVEQNRNIGVCIREQSP